MKIGDKVKILRVTEPEPTTAGTKTIYLIFDTEGNISQKLSITPGAQGVIIEEEHNSKYLIQIEGDPPFEWWLHRDDLELI